MIEVELDYVFDCFDAVIEALRSAPEPLRLIRFGSDERASNSADAVSDEKRFRSFLKKASSGFFLYSDRITYSFTIRPTQGFEVYVPEIETAHAEILLKHLAIPGVRFGYAADGGERTHRNRLSKKASYGLDEAWVGRDWRRYVPGLYWTTVISDELMQMNGVPLIPLTQASKAIVDAAPGIHVLKFFGQPEKWRLESERLDQLCETTPGVFAISRVRPDFERAKTFVETAEVLHAWR